MENPARARRLADALSAAVGKLPGRRLLGIRDNHVVALISNTRRVSGWTAPQSKLAERVFPALTTLGPAVLIGMSADVPSTSHIPKALEEARVALDFAHVGQRVVRYSDIPVRQMILRQARSGVQSALPVWVDALLVADRKSGGSLVGTLRAYASANMNVLQAAKKLNVHPNTIYARMQRINDITGYDAREFNALNELLLAADCRQ
jgi:sugar diacid utilization regulator